VSNKLNLRQIAVLLFAVFATAALVLADVGALAQNSNTSTTTEESMQNGNAQMSTPRRGRRGRRGRTTRTNANTGDATTNTGDATGDTTMAGDQNANMGGEATTGAGGRGRRGRRGRRRAPAATTGDTTGTDATTGTDVGAGATQTGGGTGDVSGEQTDLSGTYTGHVTMTGGHEMNGEATLTITGNQFTLASEGMTHNGRVTAVTTRGYTGASFFFTDLTDSTTNTPVVATVRARRMGDRLSLSPVPGARTRMTFAPGGGAGGGRRGRRGRRSPTVTEPISVIAPVTSPEGTEATGTEATGTGTTGTTGRGRRGRRGRRGGTTNTNANTGDNTNTTPPR